MLFYALIFQHKKVNTKTINVEIVMGPTDWLPWHSKKSFIDCQFHIYLQIQIISDLFSYSIEFVYKHNLKKKAYIRIDNVIACH